MRPNNNPYAQYKQMQVMTTDPVRLVVMMYEGAIKALRSSIENIQDKRFEAKGKDLLKAHDILFELMSCLDHEKGGDVAKNLAALYTYMIKRILEANVSLDVQIIDEVIRHLETLNEGWRTLADNRGKVPGSSEPESATTLTPAER